MCRQVLLETRDVVDGVASPGKLIGFATTPTDRQSRVLTLGRSAVAYFVVEIFDARLTIACDLHEGGSTGDVTSVLAVERFGDVATSFENEFVICGEVHLHAVDALLVGEDQLCEKSDGVSLDDGLAIDDSDHVQLL